MSDRPSTFRNDLQALDARLRQLEQVVFGKTSVKGTFKSERSHTAENSRTDPRVDFSMPVRAFVKKHCKGRSGPKQFTLLVAYLAQGDLAKRVPMMDVVKSWNKLTGILGMKFNGAHSVRARENDWVTTEKAGLYHLRPGWKNALS